MASPATANFLAPVIAVVLRKNGIISCKDLTWDELAEQISDKSLPARHPLKLLIGGLKAVQTVSQISWQLALHCQAYLVTDEKISLVQEVLSGYTDETSLYAAKACTSESKLCVAICFV